MSSGQETRPQVTTKERDQIAERCRVMYPYGVPVEAIAKQVGRSPHTVAKIMDEIGLKRH